jgi:hypothetical protein
MDKDQLSEVNRNLEELTERLSKQNSFLRRFFMSILTGLGSAIGAIVVFGILLAIVSASIDRASDLPLIGKYFDEINDVVNQD